MSHILIVDDDELILKVAKSVLQKAGHAVTLAKDGHQALEAIDQELYDLIITDANMPGGISGFTLASTVRKNERISTIPIMFLTGRKDKADVARALESGADDYIVKPIDPDILLAKVDGLISKKKNAYGFSLAKLKANGTWSLDFEIVAMSEQGLNIVSKSSIPVNTKVRIDSDLFEIMGIKPPQIRVVSCTLLQNPVPTYFVEVSFVGLGESDLSLIRRWVIANNRSQSA
ncbi:MAG: response regulator [Pseudobdellovibrio sp.]